MSPDVTWTEAIDHPKRIQHGDTRGTSVLLRPSSENPDVESRTTSVMTSTIRLLVFYSTFTRGR